MSRYTSILESINTAPRFIFILSHVLILHSRLACGSVSFNVTWRGMNFLAISQGIMFHNLLKIVIITVDVGEIVNMVEG